MRGNSAEVASDLSIKDSSAGRISEQSEGLPAEAQPKTGLPAEASAKAGKKIGRRVGEEVESARIRTFAI